MKIKCKKHGFTEHSKRSDRSGFRCRKCLVEAVQKRREVLKLKSIEYKGGKCEKCGYSKCVGALEFHHKDPATKKFGIGNKGHSRSWERVKKELDKCIMICANCHREIHAEIAKR